MMAAPPSRSHFELSTTDPGVDLSDPTSTGRNGSKKYSDKHMDGSLRVSSASTETTAASTFVANEEGDQDNMDMSNSHSNSHALSSPRGLHVDVNQEEELMDEEDTKLGVASAIYDPKCSTLSLPEFPTHVLESQPHPLQVEPVARMPKAKPEIDPEVLRIAEEINSPKQAPIDDDEDLDKKPAAKPSPIKPNLMDSKRSPSRSPKQSVTFAELPPAAAKAAIQSPDLLDDSQHSSSHNSDEQSLTRPTNLNNRQRAKSDGAGTSPIPTPRGRGLRGRRQPQTAADRNNRRKQIMERTSLDGPSRSKSPLASPNHTPRVSSAPPEPGMVCSPLVATTPRTPTSAAAVSPAEPNNSNPTLPGDSLLGNKKPAPKSAPAPGDSLLGNRPTPRSAPGDNLRSPHAAAPGDRMAPRSRSPNGGPIIRPNVRSRVIRPITPPPGSKLANANPPASAYEVAASANQSSGNNDTESSKQRHKNLPSSMKPGAYKEIPGRGLVRNNTLRFDFFAKKKRSLRKLFSSSRRNDWSAVANSQRNLGDTGSSPMDISTQTDGFRNSYVIDENSNDNTNNNNSSSPRSVFRRSASLKSIQSVLVDDSEKGTRTYLGKISFRSLNTAKKGGLSVARPVFQKEASTLEALCIIPGDLAVAVALDSDLNGACQVDAKARAEAMKSPPPSPPPPPLPTEKTPAKAARKMFKTAALVVGTPIKLLKKTPDALKRAPEAIRKTPKAIASTPRRGLGLLKKMRRPRRSYLGNSDPMQKTKSVAKLAVPGASDSATEGAGSAVRRHSF